MRPQELAAAVVAAFPDDLERPLGVYVHVPFCASKCHFCDWVVDIPVQRLRSDASRRARYVDGVCAQIASLGVLLTSLGYRPRVMYWGGGTPTRLDPVELRRIWRALQESLDWSELVQWSVETTPNDMTPDRAETLAEMGVERVSIGAQSYNPYQLRRSGRAHSGEQTDAAVHAIRAAGITNFNIDLISGFPGEDLGSLADTLTRTLALDPPHVSVYPYRATPHTVMAMQLEKGTREVWDQPHMLEAYEMAMELLSAAGYHEYCHGYWVREAAAEDHDGNYKYDLAGDKIGFGSGAESIIAHHLLWNENTKYEEYLANPRRFTHAHRFSLDDPERMTASVGGALMTREGVVFSRFARLTGVRFEELRETPYMRRWLGVLQECGAEYIDDGESLRIDPRVIHRAYITHLAHTMAAGLDTKRA